jgi:hypothetical protein
VIWDDASELTGGWTKEIEKNEPALAMSAGYLVSKTKEHIILAQDTDSEGHHNGRGQIPIGMVKQITIVRKKDKPNRESKSHHGPKRTDK